ncbi:MAG TPA: hypothetical protein VJB57_10745 [Dehalococcoidia bacterium]|nr:hypothetical protein [Dehalococcoidia bacterium]
MSRIEVSLAPRLFRGRLDVATRKLGLDALLTLSLLAVTAGFYWWFIESTTLTYAGQKFYTLFDDAMISMRYARNLAGGHGLVWNPGETPVEGYTNPLWTLWMAALHLVGLPEASISLYVSLSGALLVAGSALVTRQIAAHIYPESPSLGKIALFGSALYYPLVFWSLRGMEVGLVTFLLCVSVLLALRLRRRFSMLDVAGIMLVSSLGILTRMEFLIPALVVCGFALFWSPTPRVAVALTLGTAILVTLEGLTAFRVIYYGELLPNTYYLKVEGIAMSARLSRGLATLLLLHVVHLGPVLAVIEGYFWKQRLRLQPGETLIVLLFASLCGYSVWVGGDAWDHYGFTNRYIAPVMPLMLLLAVRATRSLVDGIAFLRPVVWLPAIALLLVINAAPVATLVRSGAPHSDGDAAWTAYGLLLRETTAPDASLSVTWAGAVSYFSHRESFDQLGKTDAVIAKGPSVAANFRPGHSKWDHGYSFGELRPDVITAIYYASKDDIQLIRRAGYASVVDSCLYRTGSTKVDVERLRAGLTQLRSEPRYQGLLCVPQASGSAAP